MSYSKKIAIFNKCVQAYQILSGDDREICICPMCGIGFTIEAIDNKILTLEHIPPESLGGKDILLTCASCNNTAGHKLDSEIFSRQKNLNLLTALTKKRIDYFGRVKLEIAGERLNFDLSIDSKTGHVCYKPAGNNPKAMEKYCTEMEQFGKGGLWDGTFRTTTVHGYDVWLSKVGDLRLAYLAAFAVFGYSYIFNDRLSKIREQILNPDNKILSGFWQSFNFELNEKFLLVADKPINMLIAVLDHNMVILPWIRGSENPYEELVSMYPKGQVIQYSGTKYLWPDKVSLACDFAKRIR